MEHTDNSRIAAISEEAAAWFVRLKDGDLTAAENREYLAWLRQAPAHVAEMLRMAQVFRVAKRAGLKGRITFADAGPNVVELPSPAAVAAPPIRWRAAAAWSAIAVTAVLATVAYVATAGQTVQTAAGEWRHVTLDDGSFLRLGPRTRLKVLFADRERWVKLQAGEATFQVAKDATRPFIVDSGLAPVRAVGTMFGVQRESGRVVVTVAEGAVAVAKIPVMAGQQISVSAAGPGAVRQVDVARELAWAEGRLIFETETLAQALEQFNRRNRLQIRVPDPAIAGRPVRGVFDAADPRSFLDFLATAAQLEAAPARGDIVTLRKKRGDESGR